MAYVCYRYHTSLEMGPLMGGCTVAQLFQLHTAPQRSKGGMAYWAAGVEGYKACGKGLDSTPTWCVCVCVYVCRGSRACRQWQIQGFVCHVSCPTHLSLTQQPPLLGFWCPRASSHRATRCTTHTQPALHTASVVISSMSSGQLLGIAILHTYPNVGKRADTEGVAACL